MPEPFFLDEWAGAVPMLFQVIYSFPYEPFIS